MKELFRTLPSKTQLEIAEQLAVYDTCHVEYYYGEYHVTSDYILSAENPADFKMIGKEFKAKDFYSNILWYHNAWYTFCRKQEVDKSLTSEMFDSWANEQMKKAVENYLK